MIKRQDIVGMTSKHIGQVCKLSQRLVGNQITHWTFHDLPKLQFLPTPQGVGGVGQPFLIRDKFHTFPILHVREEISAKRIGLKNKI